MSDVFPDCIAKLNLTKEGGLRSVIPYKDTVAFLVVGIRDGQPFAYIEPIGGINE